MRRGGVGGGTWATRKESCARCSLCKAEGERSRCPEWKLQDFAGPFHVGRLFPRQGDAHTDSQVRSNCFFGGKHAHTHTIQSLSPSLRFVCVLGVLLGFFAPFQQRCDTRRQHLKCNTYDFDPQVMALGTCALVLLGLDFSSMFDGYTTKYQAAEGFLPPPVKLGPGTPDCLTVTASEDASHVNRMQHSAKPAPKEHGLHPSDELLTHPPFENMAPRPGTENYDHGESLGSGLFCQPMDLCRGFVSRRWCFARLSRRVAVQKQRLIKVAFFVSVVVSIIVVLELNSFISIKR